MDLVNYGKVRDVQDGFSVVEKEWVVSIDGRKEGKCLCSGLKGCWDMNGFGR